MPRRPSDLWPSLWELLADLAAFITIVVALLLVLGSLAHGADPLYTVDPASRTLRTPLYLAEIDCEAHCTKRLTYTVRVEDIASTNSQQRDYFTPPELADILLEDADYKGSGLHRGHLRDLGLSTGSPSWPVVNAHCNLVPMTQELNLGVWRALGEQIRKLAERRGSVDCTIVVQFDLPADSPLPMPGLSLPQADEPHCIPTRFCVSLNAVGQVETYTIPNDRVKRTLEDCRATP